MMDISHNKFVTPKILSGSTLKIIATIAMVANHVGIIILGAITELIWFPMRINGEITPEQYEQINYFIRLTLYNMGNLAFPLFCLLVSEGYRYTHNREKYIFRMLLFAIISELPFDIGFFSALSTAAKTFPFYWNHQNVFFTYFLSLMCLYSLDKLKTNYAGYHHKINLFPTLLSIICVSIIAFIAEFIKCDYGAMGVLFVVFFYLFRNRNICQAGILLIVYMIMTGNQPNLFLILAALIILLYNGRKGREMNKYFFYLFYPVHIVVLYSFTLILRMLV